MARKAKQILRHKRIAVESNHFDVEINGRFVGVWTWEKLDNYKKLFPQVIYIDETDGEQELIPKTNDI